MRDPRLTKLADLLVNYSTEVKPGQLVRIAGGAIAMPLISEVVRSVLKAGGYPMIRMTSEEIDEIIVKNANDAQLKYLNPVGQFEVEQIDAHIGIWADENTRFMTNVDSSRLATQQAARKPISERFMKRAADNKLRWVGTQYPTQGAAQDAEMSLSEYEDFVFGAGLLDHPNPADSWRKISQRQQRLADFLTGKSDYRVVAANGTDLRMSVAGRKWINCDGQANFPDGEVFTGPVLDSAEGVVQFSFPAVHHGQEVLDARLVFRGGRVVDASASKGQDFLIKMLDMDAGARLLGECAIGTNYGITRFTRNTLFDEKIGGTVHFAVGAGYPETGNDNESGLHWDMVVDLRRGGHIEIDGEVFQRDGRFLKDEFPCP
jgi:aminopeptidase